VIELSRYCCQRQISEWTGLSKTTVWSVQHKYHLVLPFGRSSSTATPHGQGHAAVIKDKLNA
jgi:hypothetical protein